MLTHHQKQGSGARSFTHPENTILENENKRVIPHKVSMRTKVKNMLQIKGNRQQREIIITCVTFWELEGTAFEG